MQERIQKILAHGGIASRRAAEELIRAGRVRVNGKIVTELGAKANPRYDKVEVDGKRVIAEDNVYIVLHKPRGVVSTMSDPEGRPSVKELITSIDGRVYPVGRLDFATSGVLLITNDGEMHDGLLHPRKAVPKTYVLKVKGVMKPEDLDLWRKGVRLEDGMTLPAQAKLLRHEGDKTWLELTIREGRNQQIRRMGEATGFPVMRLARLAFAEISAEGLAPGRWRHLTRDELVALKKEYGVPKSIPAMPETQPARRIQARAVNVRGAVKGAAGRTQRNFGAEAGEGGGSTERSSRFARRDEGAENWGSAREARGTADSGPERAGSRGGRGAPRGGSERGPSRGGSGERGPSRGGSGERGPSRGAERGPRGGAERDSRGAGGERPPSTRGGARDGASPSRSGSGNPRAGGAPRPGVRDSGEGPGAAREPRGGSKSGGGENWGERGGSGASGGGPRGGRTGGPSRSRSR